MGTALFHAFYVFGAKSDARQLVRRRTNVPTREVLHRLHSRADVLKVGAVGVAILPSSGSSRRRTPQAASNASSTAEYILQPPTRRVAWAASFSERRTICRGGQIVSRAPSNATQSSRRQDGTSMATAALTIVVREIHGRPPARRRHVEAPLSNRWKRINGHVRCCAQMPQHDRALRDSRNRVEGNAWSCEGGTCFVAAAAWWHGARPKDLLGRRARNSRGCRPPGGHALVPASARRNH